VLGDEYLVAVRRRKHRAGVKAHTQGSHMRPQVQHRWYKILAGTLGAKLRVSDVLAMAVGVTKVQAWFGSVIEFVRRHVVAKHVTTIIGEPQFFRLWMPIEPYRVAYAMRKYFKPCLVEIQTGNGGIAYIRALADIAWRADWHVEQAIRPQTDKFPAMMGIARIFVCKHYRWWRIGQVRLNIVITQDAADFRYIERTIVKGHAVWHL